MKNLRTVTQTKGRLSNSRLSCTHIKPKNFKLKRIIKWAYNGQ